MLQKKIEIGAMFCVVTFYVRIVNFCVNCDMLRDLLRQDALIVICCVGVINCGCTPPVWDCIILSRIIVPVYRENLNGGENSL